MTVLRDPESDANKKNSNREYFIPYYVLICFHCKSFHKLDFDTSDKKRTIEGNE